MIDRHNEQQGQEEAGRRRGVPGGHRRLEDPRPPTRPPPAASLGPALHPRSHHRQAGAGRGATQGNLDLVTLSGLERSYIGDLEIIRNNLGWICIKN